MTSKRLIGVYVVEADWLVKVLGMVNLEDEESLGYFQRVLRQSGIIDRLEEMGINEGDTAVSYTHLDVYKRQGYSSLVLLDSVLVKSTIL